MVLHQFRSAVSAVLGVVVDHLERELVVIVLDAPRSRFQGPEQESDLGLEHGAFVAVTPKIAPHAMFAEPVRMKRCDVEITDAGHERCP